jgi:choline dehydrogenase-like flavoprotein
LTALNIKTTFDADETKNVDVCIIGTGAGGAVVGYHLAQSGLKVLMLEKGDYYSHDDIKSETREENLQKLWKNRGAQLTKLPLLAITQGECVGGSTIINYGMCFRIPSETLDIWKSETNVEFSQDELDKEYSEVEKQIKVRQITDAGPSHEKLEIGCKKLGYSGSWMYKNYIADEGGIKQNVLLSYLEKANPENLEIYANCKATKILKNGDKISGIQAVHINSDKTITIDVKSTILVLSAGTIASSELLLQNKIANSSGYVGKNLGFHPASSVIAQFEHVINGQNDLSMAYHCDEFGIGKTHKPGIMIESIFISPATFSAATPGIGQENAEFLAKYDHSAVAGVMIQDEAHGTISLNWSKDAVVDYTLSDVDGKKLLDGLKTIAKIFFAAGAKKVITGHIQKTVLESTDDLHLIDERGFGLGSFRTASAHPQGGNRMGTSKKNSVVNSYCRSHDIENLYICDASVFPTPLGVNPQLTVMTIASLAAKKILEQKTNIFG